MEPAVPFPPQGRRTMGDPQDPEVEVDDEENTRRTTARLPFLLFPFFFFFGFLCFVLQALNAADPSPCSGSRLGRGGEVTPR